MLSVSYFQGLLFIFLVALIWAASSVLVQSLYDEFSLDSPFFVTYIGSSLFTLWLPTKYASSSLLRFANNAFAKHHHQQQHDGTRNFLWSVLRWPTTTTTLPTYQAIPPTGEEITEDRSNQEEEEEEEETNENELDGPQVTEVVNDNNNNNNDDDDDATTTTSSMIWSNEQHFRVARWIAPVWFLANWTYNASLQETSITSSTVLASTGSLFTFLFAVATRDERFGYLKLLGVLLGVTGSILTAWSDAPSSSSTTSDDNNNIDNHDEVNGLHGWLLLRRRMSSSMTTASNDHHALRGDLFGLISAVGYGGYAVQTRILCPRDESLYSMQLVLGYIGLVNMVTLLPLALYFFFQKNATGGLSCFVVGALIVKGLFDNVLSDYLWLRAVILTNATVATVGLGMTIPLAFLSDVWLGKLGVFTLYSTLGALSVLSGFVLVNVGNNDAENVAQHRPEIVHRVSSSEDDPVEEDDSRMQQRRLH